MGPRTPYRAVRASFDDQCIIVYQAYSADIADAAISSQKLSASSAFKMSRMTWIKPSWCWMLYRCGYSFKDRGQERVLRLSIKHSHFIDLLRTACLADEKHTKDEVVIQWDPERGPALERFDYRSIQIGIPGSLMGTFVDEWICGIEDVTDKARALKKKIDEEPGVDLQQLIDLALVPVEREYDIPVDIAENLKMGNEYPSEIWYVFPTEKQNLSILVDYNQD